MPEQKYIPQLLEHLLFTRLIRTFKMAVGPAKMVLAMLGVIIVCSVGWIMDTCATMTASDPETLKSAVSAIADFGNAAEFEELVMDPGQTMELLENYKKNGSVRGVYSTLWNFIAARFNRATVLLVKRDIPGVLANIWLCVISLVWAIKYHPLYSLIYITIVIPVIGVFGGAICRCAALEFTRDEKAGIRESLRYSVTHFKSFLTGPAVSSGMVLFFATIIFTTGLIGNIPLGIGELIVAVSLLFNIMVGVVIVLLLIGTVGGLGMMFPAVAYEGSSGFDAISRSFTYIFTQPWRMILYTSIAAIYGTLSYLVVRFFVFLVLATTYLLLDIGMFDGAGGVSQLEAVWPKPEFFNLLGLSAGGAINFSQTIAYFLIHLTVLFVIGLVGAFVINFYICASTIIYSLVRYHVDRSDIEKIHAPLEDAQDITPAEEQAQENL